jgi:hypothetical protein
MDQMECSDRKRYYKAQPRALPPAS